MEQNKNLVSVCGLFCLGCGVYYATQENDEARLKLIAEKLNIPFEESRCKGCRSETRTAYCKDCFMIKCAGEKGIDFCGECNDYPCTELKEFQSKMPHRVELWKSQERIKEIGWEKWYDEMLEYYSCPSCKTLNGWYDIKCRHCENIPGSEFVKNNMEVLKTR